MNYTLDEQLLIINIFLTENALFVIIGGAIIIALASKIAGRRLRNSQKSQK